MGLNGGLFSILGCEASAHLILALVYVERQHITCSISRLNDFQSL